MKSIASADAGQQARDASRRAIVDTARVRQALGQAALYERSSGEHVVIFRGQRYVGPTVDAAIEAAKGNTL